MQGWNLRLDCLIYPLLCERDSVLIGRNPEKIWE
jgi:hypothetical protein